MISPLSGTASRGWPIILSSLFTAVLLVAAMPGFVGWWPLLFVALLPLLRSTLYLNPGRSMLAGLLTGFLYYFGLLYWIVIVLGRYGGLPLWIILPALVLLSLYMGLYLAVFSGIFSFFAGRYRDRERSIAGMLFIAPILWVGLDWLRGFLLTGFPWMDLGYGLFNQPCLIQAADLGGHHLITFCLVLVNMLVLWVVVRRRSSFQRYGRRGDRLFPLAACCFLMFIGLYSVLRYQQLSTTLSRDQYVRITAVQGNILQDEKWVPGKKKSTIETYLRLSDQAASDDRPGLIIWPETALPFYPRRDALFSKVIRLAERKKVWLLTGAPFFEIRNRLDGSRRTIHYFNSALLINPSGRFAGRYSKQHLVPFGEYVPLRQYLPFLEPLVKNVGDFTPGGSVTPLTDGPMRLGVLICFESIFPDLARQWAVSGANLLVNLTNDAWYGRSSAPYQSFAMVVFRAVETRRSLVRAANTGISGFVDPLGRIIDQSPVFQALSLTANVPICDDMTPFVCFGYHFAPACLVLALLLIVFRKRRR